MRARTNPFLWSAIYGLVAFGIGFVFGALRQLVLIPQFGEFAGYLLEFPLVTGGVCWVGWWLARAKTMTLRAALLIGIGGLAVLLIIESGFALGLAGMTAETYFDQLNPAVSLFPYGLLAMALAPWLSAKLSP